MRGRERKGEKYRWWEEEEERGRPKNDPQRIGSSSSNGITQKY